MPSTLRSAISDLAATFATSVVAAIRASNLEDILALAGAEAPAPAQRGPGRPPKARGGIGTTGTGNPSRGGGARTSRAAGGGGQPDPLAVPVEGTARAVAKKAAGVTKARPAKKTAATATRAAPAKKAAKPGRLQRRSPAEIAKALAQVVALVKENKGGLRSEQIRARLKMDKKELPRVLHAGLEKKELKSKGAKRSTVYGAA